MITRDDVEQLSRLNSGIKDTVGNYHWVNVLDGIEMYVLDSDKSVTPHLVFDGFWESWITTWVLNNVKQGDVFWDIGANTGYYSLLAYELGALVQAFEPNPVYFKMLNATKERRGIKGSFRISETALSNYTGEATLHIPTELHGSASLSEIIPGYETTEVEVSVRPLDDYTVGAGRQILKIDAEGEEERILQGARKFLDSTPHRMVLLEYTPGAYSRNFVDELFEKWSVSWIDHSGGEAPVTPEWIRAQRDWVMLVLR